MMITIARRVTFIAWVCLLICLKASTAGQLEQETTRENAFQCSKNLPRLEVLAGGGWDNLRNVDMGRILFYNYSQCKTSEDGKYIIPDNTFVIPLKTSKVSSFAKLYDHWTNFSSATSSTINLEAHGSLFFGSISGSFSESHRFVKKHQVEDKAFTTQVQLRYILYKVKIQPDSQLHPTFKNRLLEIAAYIQGNNSNQANYLADLVVRDFGSHIVTTIDAGAGLEQVENVKTTFRNDYQGHDTDIKASASASFFGKFGFSGSYTHSVSTKFTNQYLGNRTSSYTETYGGAPFKANFSVNDWESNLIDNLVAMDRAGDPLHYIITSAVLPELPEPSVIELYKTLKDAVKRYYDHNKYSGCTNPRAPNFDFQANDEDGTCHAQHTNFTFGGVYQTCSVQGSPGKNPCAGLTQKNPKTADFKCPQNYKAIQVHQGTTASNCHRSCHGAWFWMRCNTYCGHGVYATFWCVAEEDIPQSSGFLFGGIYSSTTANPVTKSQRCPSKFYPMIFGVNMHVCVSDDYELGYRYSVPFGGFFSCSTGNPLALTTRKSPSLAAFDNTTDKANGTSDGLDMKRFLFYQGPSSWPKHCPAGYSQHLATVEQNCEILYCIKTNALSEMDLVPIRRPPFSEAPGLTPNLTVPLVIVNMDTNKVYFQNPTTLNWQLASKR